MTHQSLAAYMKAIKKSSSFCICCGDERLCKSARITKREAEKFLATIFLRARKSTDGGSTYMSCHLTADLMNYDCAHHPAKDAKQLFLDWSRGGGCPYADYKGKRAIPYFQERKDYYAPRRRARTAVELVRRALTEAKVWKKV